MSLVAERVPSAAHAARPRAHRALRALVFWIKRYLPPELAGTATMLVAGVAVAAAAAPAIVIGLVGTAAENVGFYCVAAITVWREQRLNFPDDGVLRRVRRVAVLLVLEFGPAELLDTFLVRPLALTLAVHLLPDIALGLIVGKLAADVVFYVLAATAFRVTEKTGVRGEAPAAEG